MKYKCSICGYVYDESKEGISFADLPDDWQCPLCGAPKAAFEPIPEEAPERAAAPPPVIAEEIAGETLDDSMQQLSMGQMAALCSNLARGCEKLYMPQESEYFNELAEWFSMHAPKTNDATVEAITTQLQQGLSYYPVANQKCVQEGDRGAQRVLSWSEKATRMLSSLIGRYKREGDSLLVDTEIWVCTVCGFVFIGKAAPEQCPICKVPAWRFNKIERRKRV